MKRLVPRRIVISPLLASAAGEWVERQVDAELTAAVLLLRVDGATEREIASWIATLRGQGFGVIVHARCAGAEEQSGGLGVHLPANASAAAWRPRVPGLLGQSVHSLDEALDAAAAGADYVLLSPVFTPGSKPGDIRRTLGLDGLRAVCAAISVPVVALGGVRNKNAAACVAAGAWGWARMGG